MPEARLSDIVRGMSTDELKTELAKAWRPSDRLLRPLDLLLRDRIRQWRLRQVKGGYIELEIARRNCSKEQAAEINSHMKTIEGLFECIQKGLF